MDSAVMEHSYAPDYPLEKLLQDRFHITTGFHPGQREIIEHLTQGKRVLAIQRTGWGKSLCYQMVSLYYPHITIVFSPLKALMRDQCQRCNDSYAIPSAIVSSDFSEDENKATLEQAVAGSIKLLFIAPERLDNMYWQAYVPHMCISMIVIDEAHCISTWGHDFRPDYRRIVRLLSMLPQNTPVLALTATANKRVEQDILQQMGTATLVIRGSMQRPNLYLHTETLKGDTDKLSYLGEILPYLPGTGIIYTATQNNAEMVAAFLLQQDIKAEYYHARRMDSERQRIEQNFMASHYKVVCATNALGMGIDKPDIRFVIHYNIPASPIHYYQEMGRAGRDGKVSWCILLYDPADLTIQEHFIRGAKPDEQSYEMVLLLLRRYPQGLREREILLETGLARNAVRTMLADLEDERFIEYNHRVYRAVARSGNIDLAPYEVMRLHKQQELNNMQSYVQTARCYMDYLTTYLGDEPGSSCRVCGHCRKTNFPVVKPPKRIQEAAIRFLNEEFLPRIEKYGTGTKPVHEPGWSLSYHGKSYVGQLVRASKYEDAGPFALRLVFRAADVVRTRYPLDEIDGIVSVPPTKSGLLVENFARQLATQVQKEYLPVVTKVRSTREQKYCTNRDQKVENVKGAFCVDSPESIVGRTLLLIDDIFDSGYMVREVSRTLIQAGAKAVYPLTITRTAHSDDQ